MTLPAHRYLEQRKAKGDDPLTWTFDFDGTITAAPEQMARIARGLKSLGDRVVVLTGNDSPPDQLAETLDGYDFPYDALVQYHDDSSDGIARAEHLEAFDTFGAFDNRVDRAYTFAKVCPHLYLIAKPTDDDKSDAKAKGAKKAAKEAAKQIRSAPADDVTP